MLRRMNIWSVVLWFFRNPGCSFLSTWSTPFFVLSMMTFLITVLVTGNDVTPRQFLHSFKSLRFGIFTIKPFFHWSVNFSSCYNLLNSLVNSFTATSLSALYSSAQIPSISDVLPLFVFLSACLTSASFISITITIQIYIV